MRWSGIVVGGRRRTEPCWCRIGRSPAVHACDVHASAQKCWRLARCIRSAHRVRAYGDQGPLRCPKIRPSGARMPNSFARGKVLYRSAMPRFELTIKMAATMRAADIRGRWWPSTSSIRGAAARRVPEARKILPCCNASSRADRREFVMLSVRWIRSSIRGRTADYERRGAAGGLAHSITPGDVANRDPWEKLYWPSRLIGTTIPRRPSSAAMDVWTPRCDGSRYVRSAWQHLIARPLLAHPIAATKRTSQKSQSY